LPSCQGKGEGKKLRKASPGEGGKEDILSNFGRRRTFSGSTGGRGEVKGKQKDYRGFSDLLDREKNLGSPLGELSYPWEKLVHA